MSLFDDEVEAAAKAAQRAWLVIPLSIARKVACAALRAAAEVRASRWVDEVNEFRALAERHEVALALGDVAPEFHLSEDDMRRIAKALRIASGNAPPA